MKIELTKEQANQVARRLLRDLYLDLMDTKIVIPGREKEAKADVDALQRVLDLFRRFL